MATTKRKSPVKTKAKSKAASRTIRKPVAKKGSRATTARASSTARKTSARSTASRRGATAKKPAAKRAPKKWSSAVTQHSHAMDLDREVFTLSDPKRIAASLKRSAERSRRRKAEPYRSAMSMLTFYINRAGHSLPARRKRVLEKAKVELRHAFGKES